MDLLGSFEHRGLWWLPEEPERKVAGVLTFSQEDSALELIGLLPRREPVPHESGEVEVLSGPLSRPRILGLSTDGKAFTLEDCDATSFRWASRGLITERFAPRLILRGAHYEPGEKVVFDELFISYTQLDAWVDTSGFARIPSTDGEGTGIDISFREPDPVAVELPQGSLEIQFGWTLRDPSPHRPEVTLRQNSGFLLRFKQPTALEQTLDFIYQLRNFVGLGVGRPVAPTEIRGAILPPPDAEPDPLTGLNPRKLRIDLFYRLSNVPKVKDVHPAQMLFTLGEARERLETLLSNWFAKQELLRPVFDLYFGAVYNPHAFLEQRFLSLMQAVETYHRRTSPATDLPAAEHELRLSEILAATPEQYESWLRGELKHSNELALRKRLADVLRRCPAVVRNLVERRDSFIHHVLVARNYLTHYDRSLEEEAPRGLDLYPLTVQLQALAEMCLLLELGFECEEIDSFFERVSRYREAKPS